EVGPFDFRIPVRMFFYDAYVTPTVATLRIDLQEDGVIRGIIGGGVPIQEIIAITDIDGTGTVGDLIDDLSRRNADLAPDANGDCTQISATIQFDAAPAYFFADSPVLPGQIDSQAEEQ
ncbi:MAG: hypothetical protein KC561_17935, partial [Myxococcales bacterium]|nr:hypothetical protein [Myxococcales bacterium]